MGQSYFKLRDTCTPIKCTHQDSCALQPITSVELYRHLFLSLFSMLQNTFVSPKWISQSRHPIKCQCKYGSSVHWSQEMRACLQYCSFTVRSIQSHKFSFFFFSLCQQKIPEHRISLCFLSRKYHMTKAQEGKVS